MTHYRINRTRIDFVRARSRRGCDSSMMFPIELDVRSHLLSPLYEAPRSRWSPSTYARPYSWHRAGEGRTRLFARRDARTLTHWLAIPHTLLPFRVLARNRASGEHEKRETVEQEAFAGLLLSRRRGEAAGGSPRFHGSRKNFRWSVYRKDNTKGRHFGRWLNN